MDNLVQNIVRDVRTELAEEFDRNFQRKAFFDQPWPKTRFPNKRGSMMMRSGMLRRGNRATSVGNTIVFSNSEPYAALHNEGGQLVITTKMIKFFWAMYYKANGAASKGGGKRKLALSDEAQMWKALALKKPGQVLKVEKRQFIGWHPSIKPRIERVLNSHLTELDKQITKMLKR